MVVVDPAPHAATLPSDFITNVWYMPAAMAVHAPRYGRGASTTVNTEGGGDGFAKAFVMGFLREVGFDGALVLRTDLENSIRDPAKAVAQQ